MNVLENYLENMKECNDSDLFTLIPNSTPITFGDLRAFAAKHRKLVEQNSKTCEDCGNWKEFCRGNMWGVCKFWGAREGGNAQMPKALRACQYFAQKNKTVMKARWVMGNLNEKLYITDRLYSQDEADMIGFIQPVDKTWKPVEVEE